MKQQPFDGPKLKIARARKHIADFESEVAAYLSRDPSVIFAELDHKTKQRGIRLRTREPIPDNISAIFGDAVHNLRVALDLLANDLVSLSGGQPKKVYFPFADSAAGLEGEIKRKMRGASPDILTLIRSLRPYKSGNITLRALHDLDITDKHINILEPGISVTTEPLKLRRVESDRPNRLIVKADFGAMQAVPFDNAGYCGVETGGFDNLGRLAGGEVAIVIGKGLPGAGKPAIEALHQLIKLVDVIVEMFEAHCLGGKQPGP